MQIKTFQPITALAVGLQSIYKNITTPIQFKIRLLKFSSEGGHIHVIFIGARKRIEQFHKKSRRLFDFRPVARVFHGICIGEKQICCRFLQKCTGV